MAKIATNVWWAIKAQEAARIKAARKQAVNVGWVIEPDPPHENKTIQRMSEAWRELAKTGG